MRRASPIFVLVAVIAVAEVVAAHHSAAQYDFSKSITVRGIVRMFKAVNPHMRLRLQVADAHGKHDVDFEGDSLTNLRHMGYRDNMIVVGDRLTVYAAPAKDGSDGGYVIAAVNAKGLGFGMPDEGPSGLRH